MYHPALYHVPCTNVPRSRSFTFFRKRERAKNSRSVRAGLPGRRRDYVGRKTTGENNPSKWYLKIRK